MSNPNKNLDPTADLPAEAIKNAKEKANKLLCEENCRELNLMKDDTVIPQQNWALVSYIAPNLNQKNEAVGVKIKGVFADLETAKKHAAQLMKIDSTFDIYVQEMYCWCLVPPDPNAMEDQVYHEDKLNELITEHKRSQLEARELFEERKRMLMKNKGQTKSSGTPTATLPAPLPLPVTADLEEDDIFLKRKEQQ